MKIIHNLNTVNFASVIGIFISLSFTPKVIAGAWVPEVGSGYNNLAFSDFEATDFFGSNDSFNKFKGQNTSLYVEQGVAKNLAITLNTLYQEIEQIDNDDFRTSNTGFGDLEVGLRYNLVNGPFVLSTALTVKIPDLYDEDDELPLGNGQEDYEARLLFGKSLNRFGYFGLETGYRYRSSNPSDEIRYLLEYGFSATKNLYFRTKLDGIASAGNADSTLDEANPTTVTNLAVTPEFDIGKLELTTGWQFNKAKNNSSQWGVEFTYTRDLYGSDTLQGDTYQFGITRSY